MNRGFVGLIAGLAVLIAAALIFTWLGEDYRKNWGASEAEQAMTLPGDSLVLAPSVVTTRAITVNAPPESVWPWLLQMGQRRGGFYTHSALENLAGLKIHNAWQIQPEWQNVSVGDEVYLAPGDDAVMVVRELLPNHALVLQLRDSGDPAMSSFDWSWTFALVPVEKNRTRLVIRTRLRFGDSVGGVPDAALDLASWMMESGTLRGVKIRAERTAP